MKLSRLVQPGNPLFWLMLVLNGLSPVLAFFLHTYDLPLAVRLVVVGFALGNAVVGLCIAMRLMRDEPGGGDPTVVGTGRRSTGPR